MDEEASIGLQLGTGPLDHLRALLDPQTHKQQLEAARKELVKKLSAWFVELDSVQDNPEILEEHKKQSIDQFEGLIKDAAWRINRIDELLKQHDEASAAAVAGPKKTPLTAVRPAEPEA